MDGEFPRNRRNWALAVTATAQTDLPATEMLQRGARCAESAFEPVAPALHRKSEVAFLEGIRATELRVVAVHHELASFLA